MNFKVLLQDVKKVAAEALVVCCYEDVRPLKGMAGELDWLLCGALSQLLSSRKMRGSLGDIALVTPRQKISVQKLFLVGLGPRREESPAVMRSCAKIVAESLLGAGVTNAAVEYVTSESAEDAHYLRAIQEGLLEGSRGRMFNVDLLVQDASLYERLSRLVTA